MSKIYKFLMFPYLERNAINFFTSKAITKIKKLKMFFYRLSYNQVLASSSEHIKRYNTNKKNTHKCELSNYINKTRRV